MFPVPRSTKPSAFSAACSNLSRGASQLRAAPVFLHPSSSIPPVPSHSQSVMKHLLSIEALTRDEIYTILDLADTMKRTRGHHESHPLRHQCWALMFSKSSTRTRVSFEVGVRELGGDVM